MERIIFEDLPSTNTPINAENLNKIQENTENAIEEGKKYCEAILLYQNADGINSGEITLNDSVENYKRLKIFYFDGDNVNSSTEVYEPNGKTISLESTKHGPDGSYAIIIYMQNVSINNNKVTFSNNPRALVVNSNGTIHSAGVGNTETIYRIEGYKY